MGIGQWWANLPKNKRTIYIVLLGIIIFTIPCYCLGMLALLSGPTTIVTPTPLRFTPTLGPAEKLSPTATRPAGTPTATLEPTPTEFFPTGAPSDTPTPAPPTETPTQTPTGTLAPSDTPTATPTLDTTATAQAATATAQAINGTATAQAATAQAINGTATAQAEAAAATATAQAATAQAINSTATAQAATATAQAGSPPEARDDTATTSQNTPVNIDVLANDAPGDNGNFNRNSVSVVSGPDNGTALVENNGSITYTPDTDFTGTDVFAYQVCNTFNACDTANVTVTVNP